MKQMQKVMMMFVISFMFMMTFVNANTIEIANDITGTEGSVYDADTLQPVSGFRLLERPQSFSSFFRPAIIAFEGDEYCIGEKIYWTFYATVDGVGAWHEYQDANKLLYEELETGNNCYVKHMLLDSEIRFDGSYYLMKDSEISYRYTSDQKWVQYGSDIEPGVYWFFIYAKCDGPTYVFHNEETVDAIKITLKDCAQPVECPDTMYTCVWGKSYKTTFDELNDCVSVTVIDSDPARTLICAREYCVSQHKYWYDNACYDNPQCIPSWTCGSWGACNPDTKTQLRYCNDGCGNAKTETQGCTPEPDCGDGNCGEDEDCHNCPQDCGDCLHECGDGVCDSAEGEDYINCPSDCTKPIECGDGKCELEETEENCPADCKDEPYCGDGVCDPLTESCVNCPQDCDICKLCIVNSECIPANPDECIEYICYEGQCREVPILTEECIGQNWWQKIWDDYKYYIIGGGATLFFGVAFVVMLIMAGITYWLITRQPSGVRK